MDNLSREETVELLIENYAWENPRRVQVDSEDGQIVLDKFRDFLAHKLSVITDNELPKSSQFRDFIYTEWAEFIKCNYGIIQTWEEYKHQIPVRMA